MEGRNDAKIIKAVSHRENKRVRAIKTRSIRQEKRDRRESFVVSTERTAGDGRIMTEGGACLTPLDLFLDPAAGKS